MKLKVNWKELGKQLWVAVKPVLLAAVGGGIVTMAAGCSSLVPTSKTQTLSVVGIGIPAIAVVSSSAKQAGQSSEREKQGARQISRAPRFGAPGGRALPRGITSRSTS